MQAQSLQNEERRIRAQPRQDPAWKLQKKALTQWRYVGILQNGEKQWALLMDPKQQWLRLSAGQKFGKGQFRIQKISRKALEIALCNGEKIPMPLTVQKGEN